MPTGCTILESLLQSASPADFWSHVSSASLPRWNAQTFKLANAEHMLAPPASMQRQIAFTCFAQHSGQQLQTCFHQSDTDGTSQQHEANSQSRDHEGVHDSESNGHTTTNGTDISESDERVETGTHGGHSEQVDPPPETDVDRRPETDEDSLRAQRGEHDRPDSALEEKESLSAQHGSELETNELEDPLKDKTREARELDREGEEDVTSSTHASSEELQDTEHPHEEGHQHNHRDLLGSASAGAQQLQETGEAHRDKLEVGRGLLESAREAHAHRLGGESESTRDLQEASFNQLREEEAEALHNINDQVEKRLLELRKDMEGEIQRYAHLLSKRQAEELASREQGQAITGTRIRVPLSPTQNVVNLEALDPSSQTSNGIGSTHDEMQKLTERMDAALKKLAHPGVHTKDSQVVDETPQQLIEHFAKLLHSMKHHNAQFQERPMSKKRPMSLSNETGSHQSVDEVLASPDVLAQLSGQHPIPSSVNEFM